MVHFRSLAKAIKISKIIDRENRFAFLTIYYFIVILNLQMKIILISKIQIDMNNYNRSFYFKAFCFEYLLVNFFHLLINQFLRTLGKKYLIEPFQKKIRNPCYGYQWKIPGEGRGYSKSCLEL